MSGKKTPESAAPDAKAKEAEASKAKVSKPKKAAKPKSTKPKAPKKEAPELRAPAEPKSDQATMYMLDKKLKKFRDVSPDSPNGGKRKM
ncbi:hypothetical protein MF545_12460 [Stenotrophomonas maltophilia]|nr:hypothetical protein [Stenotrophomonas maltophilia]